MPSPNWVPCATALPTLPPMMEPTMAPSSVPNLVLGRLRGLSGAVPQRHVADFVRDDAGDLTFGTGRLDHAAIDVQRSARQRERVDLAHVDDPERVAETGLLQVLRDGLDHPPPDGRHPRRQGLVCEHRQLLLDLHGSLPPELHVLRRGVPVVRRRDDGLPANRTHRQQHADANDTQNPTNACVHGRPQERDGRRLVQSLDRLFSLGQERGAPPRRWMHKVARTARVRCPV